MGKRLIEEERKTKDGNEIRYSAVFTIVVMLAILLLPSSIQTLSVDTPLAGINATGSSSPIAHIDIPEVQVGDDGNFYSVQTSSGSNNSLLGFGRSFQISTSVPSLWTRTENFNVEVHVYLSGYLYADVSIVFEGFDNYPGPSEVREVYKRKTVRASGSHSIHTLSCYVPSTSSVGLKRAQVLVSGKAYYYDILFAPPGGLKHDYVSRTQSWGYDFVARYGLTDLQTYGGLPPSDAMSTASGNPSYYWEGMPEGGFNILVTRALFRPMVWPIMYQAGYLVDNHISYPEYSAEVLTLTVHDLLTYYENTDTLFTTNADMFTYNYNWRGICDEFAVILCSFLRVINIPSRYMIGYDAGHYGGPWTHAWSEVYVSGSWTHCDATMNLFDKPWYYGLNLVTMDWVRIYSCGDDGRGTWSIYDGDTVNGKLDCYKDWYYYVFYDGPNNY